MSVAAPARASAAGALERLAGLAARRPWHALGVVVTLHVALWTLLPSLLLANPPFDVIEGLTFGQAGEWGNAKHPPLQAFLLVAADRLTGGALWSFFLLSQLAVGISFVALFALGRRLLPPREALIAVLLLEGVVYFNVTSPEFNPNVLQLPLWTLVAWAAHVAMREARPWAWALLGLLAGLAMLAKYASALLLLVLLAVMLAEPQARRQLRGAGPYLAALVFILSITPHLLWLLDHRFESFAYVLRRGAAEAAWSNHVVFPLRFAAAQALALAPAALLLLVLVGGRPWLRPAPALDRFDRRFLAAVAIAPSLLAIGFSALLGFRLKSMWGTPMLCFIGLLAVALLRPARDERRLARFAAAWVGLVALTAGGYGLAMLLHPWLGGTAQRGLFPGQSIAARLDDGHRALTGAPPAYVVGSLWLAGNVAHHAASRPVPHIDGERRQSPWVDEADLRRRGAVIAWRLDVAEGAGPDLLLARFPEARPQPPFEAPWLSGAAIAPVRIGWAVLPPAPR